MAVVRPKVTSDGTWHFFDGALKTYFVSSTPTLSLRARSSVLETLTRVLAGAALLHRRIISISTKQRCLTSSKARFAT